MTRATMLTLNRTFTLNTTKGHSIEFVKGKSVYVPPAVYGDAIAIGAFPSDGSEPTPLDEDVIRSEITDPAERAQMISMAFDVLVERNGRGDFTAAGVPTAAAVTAETGFKVQNKEVVQAWQIRNDAKAAE